MIEELIAFHCGPALAGIKAANMVTCSKSKYPNLYSDINRLNEELNRCGIYFEILCECDKSVLVMVYRKKTLTSYIKQSQISDFLTQYGYSKQFTLREYIDRLKGRITQNNEFPHEIGAFLGYPIEDINGFINNKNEGCLYVGTWRVYADAENKIKLFDRYNNCRNCIVKRINSGISLSKLFKVA